MHACAPSHAAGRAPALAAVLMNLHAMHDHKSQCMHVSLHEQQPVPWCQLLSLWICMQCMIMNHQNCMHLCMLSSTAAYALAPAAGPMHLRALHDHCPPVLHACLHSLIHTSLCPGASCCPARSACTACSLPTSIACMPVSLHEQQPVPWCQLLLERI